MSIIGIDEVGRGALAGPVVVAALLIRKGFRVKKRLGKLLLRDSKSLSALGREKWFRYIKEEEKISFVTSRVYQRGIEKMNITRAANFSAVKAFRRLQKSVHSKKYKVILDGGLYLKIGSKSLDVNSRTIVKGDQKFDAIKLASIVAKVTRDRYMKNLHKVYPKYGFYLHKGYGTAKHIRAIKKYGVSDVHRLTFLKNYIKL